MNASYQHNPWESHSFWKGFGHLDLEEMKGVRLMNRVDTKYLAPLAKLFPLLEKAKETGFKVQFGKSAINGYHSTYFDTPNLDMYTMHHNRKLQRQKVRMRTYLDTRTSFFEIKNKSNTGRTRKVRILVNNPETDRLKDNKEACQFLQQNSHYQLEDLVPTLQTVFDRITLVNSEKTERITIDLNLRFHNLVCNQDADLEDIVIIELKQDGNYTSHMKRILQFLRIHPFHISKYCIGTVLTNPKAKHNRFKRKIHLINKIKNIYEYIN